MEGHNAKETDLEESDLKGIQPHYHLVSKKILSSFHSPCVFTDLNRLPLIFYATSNGLTPNKHHPYTYPNLRSKTILSRKPLRSDKH